MRDSYDAGTDDGDSVLSPNPLRRLFARRGEERERKDPLGLRIRAAMLKPPKPGSGPVESAPRSVEELRAEAQSANDKERLIGLIAAPFAAAIGLLVTDVLISHDPPARLSNGTVNRLHVSIGLYHEVLVTLLVLSVVMLVMSLLRKRLYLGIAMALFGLTIFNLHYWGFGIPFLLGGAWYLVRNHRTRRDLREATGEAPPRFGSRPAATTGTSFSKPRASKRYTPPASQHRA